MQNTKYQINRLGQHFPRHLSNPTKFRICHACKCIIKYNNVEYNGDIDTKGNPFGEWNMKTGLTEQKIKFVVGQKDEEGLFTGFVESETGDFIFGSYTCNIYIYKGEWSGGKKDGMGEMMFLPKDLSKINNKNIYYSFLNHSQENRVILLKDKAYRHEEIYNLSETERCNIDRDGNLFTEGVKYVGSFKNNQMNGRGILYSYDDKIIYDGEWKDCMKHGKGNLYNEKGNVFYTGDWRYNGKDGHGTIVFEDNIDFGSCAMRYEGELHNDVGYHAMRYEGEFCEDFAFGKGVMYCKNGDIFTGTFHRNMAIDGVLKIGHGKHSGWIYQDGSGLTASMIKPDVDIDLKNVEDTIIDSKGNLLYKPKKISNKEDVTNNSTNLADGQLNLIKIGRPIRLKSRNNNLTPISTLGRAATQDKLQSISQSALNDLKQRYFENLTAQGNPKLDKNNLRYSQKQIPSKIQGEDIKRKSADLRSRNNTLTPISTLGRTTVQDKLQSISQSALNDLKQRDFRINIRNGSNKGIKNNNLVLSQTRAGLNILNKNSSINRLSEERGIEYSKIHCQFVNNTKDKLQPISQLTLNGSLYKSVKSNGRNGWIENIEHNTPISKSNNFLTLTPQDKPKIDQNNLKECFPRNIQTTIQSRNGSIEEGKSKTTLPPKPPLYSKSKKTLLTTYRN